MGKTARDVFRIAMSLSDNIDETTGQAENEDTKEYLVRTLDLLNSFIDVLYPYSDTYVKSKVKGKRSVIKKLESLDEDIDLDDYCLFDVAPYKLAALLFLDENASFASTMENIYIERLGKLMSGFGLMAESEDIVDVYGGGFYNEFGEWEWYGGDPIGFSRASRW